MAEQQQLDLPPPAPRAPVRSARRSFAGFSRGQLIVGIAVLAAVVWGMWVTRSLAAARHDRIVSARLSSIVGDYVTAEARSASPPAQVQAEMRAFMAGLASELQRRSARGDVVLVGEAVLTKNVPDITDELKRAVYASGVPAPHQATAAELQRLSPAGPVSPGAPGMPVAAATAAPTAAGTAPAFAMPPSFPPPATEAAAPGQPAPSVATFGGPNGDGSR